ncbi:MAG TPA: hypothetical protein VFT22_10260 [Kofleriaceae bacterium]|nr:hypothetical protein [Kofleriaceae bacterium]
MSDRIETTRLPFTVRSADQATNLFAGAHDEATEFRNLIEASGGCVPARSPLAHSLDGYVRAAAFISSGREPTTDDATDMKDAIRVRFVVRAVMAAYRHQVPHLDERLREIRGEDVIISGECGAQSKARDTMWEIVTAGLCTRFASQVVLIDPPDVTCNINGTRWSVACKMLRSPSGRQQMKRVVEGAKQVERHPDADRGIVLVNVTDAVFHVPWSSPMNMNVSIPMFEAAMSETVRGLDRRDLFDGLARRPKVRTFMLFGQTMLDTGDTAMLATIASWPRSLQQASPDQGEAALLQAVNDAARALLE